MQTQFQFTTQESPRSPGRPRSLKRENDHQRRRKSRAEIKAAGCGEYEALLVRERTQRKRFRQSHPGYWRAYEKKNGKPFKSLLCSNARARGRKKGIAATITPQDIHWPTHCPVLGIELDYPERSGQRKGMVAAPNWPSLDRWDNTKGYVPGNVFVISLRANTLKNSATYEEMLRVARYLAKRPKAP